MYPMMNTIGWGTGFLLFWGLHVLSVITFGIGAAFLLFWAFKRLTEPQLWKWGWALVISGTIACFLALATFPSAVLSSPLGMSRDGSRFGMMGGGMMGRGMMMGMPMMGGMGWWAGDVSDEDAEKTAAEVQEGEELWAKLQRKEVTCTGLNDEQFGAIGEYVMDRMHGNAHATMNRMMEAMMGEEGEERMHILTGKRFSGCVNNEEFDDLIEQFRQDGRQGDLLIE